MNCTAHCSHYPNCNCVTAFAGAPYVQQPQKQFGWWQLCPKCSGDGGVIVYFGWHTCDVCKGEKIIKRPEL